MEWNENKKISISNDTFHAISTPIDTLFFAAVSIWLLQIWHAMRRNKKKMRAQPKFSK